MEIKEFIEKYGDLRRFDGNHYKGSLSLDGCTGLTSLPEGLTVGGDLSLRGCTGLTSLPEGLTVGGDLYLRGCTGLTSLPEGLTVGGYLYLDGCTGLTSLPEGLTVGGYLSLDGCTGLTSLPEGLTVGGDLYLDGSGIPSSERAKVNRNVPSVFKWEFHGREYIKADGIFQRVISHHGNVYRVRRIGKTDETYLVTDGAGKWSHGQTLEEARRDLLYKIGSRDTSRYTGLTLDSVLPLAEAIECYRVITGACAAGTKHFMEDILREADRREEYTIAEMIRLTAGQYGSQTFRAFFEKR